VSAHLPEAEVLARLQLWLSPGIGPLNYRHLMEAAGSAQAAVAAFPALVARAGRAKSASLADPAAARAERDSIRRAKARPLCHGTADYPPLLNQIEGAPPILVARGNPALAAQNPIAIIGARNASPAGLRLARQFAATLATAGHAVVSGLARGIDAAAHQAALAAHGPTIGVIASGIDIAYPPEHAALQEQIAREGLLLSDVPCGTEPIARRFPARNRVIAGLSLGVVVAEAAPGSGTLLTATMAIEMGREVMAIPGSPLDPRSRGCNGLIRDGAILVQDPEDVIELLTGFTGAARYDARAEPTPTPPSENLPPADLAEALLALLSPVPMPVDELIRLAAAPTAEVQMALIELELAALIHRHPGGRVSRAA